MDNLRKNIDEIERVLEAALTEAPASSKATLAKAMAELAPLWALSDSLGHISKLRQGLGLPGAGDGPLGLATDLVLRGVSAPRALRLAGLVPGEAVLEVMRRAEDLRGAALEVGLMARAMLDTGASGLAALKAWQEGAEVITREDADTEPTLKDLVLDAPELTELVRQRYGDPLGHDPGAVA